MPKIIISMVLFSALLSLPACSKGVTSDPGYGANPTLPDPDHAFVPTLNIALAKGWADGANPVAAAGFAVSSFATGLDHPRWMYVLPNGDVLVAETNAPFKPEDSKGLKGAVMKHEQKKAGAGSKSANRITLLRGIG